MDNRIVGATYVGPDCGWNVTAGLHALVRPSETPGDVLAQFDDFNVQRQGISLCFGWHKYPANHFKMDDQHVQ